MRHVRVREGNTGILYLTDEHGVAEKYIPDYDLDKARELLLEFQELKDVRGNLLKENYWREGFNWYPSMVSHLYWYVFFQYVKFAPLLHRALAGEVSFQHENRLNFYRILETLQGIDRGSRLKQHIFYTLVALNNIAVLRKHAVHLLFYGFSLDNFRSREVRKTLDELRARYILVLPPGRIIDAVKNLVERKPYYFFGGLPRKNLFQHEYDLSRLEMDKKLLFQCTIENLERTISGYVREYQSHRSHLKRSSITLFYGFDDSNGYLFPLLYACHKCGVKTIGHQHGAYVKRHAAYTMEGIEKEEYDWFHKLIVWGPYWKDHLLRISRAHSPEKVLVGSNKLSWDYAGKRHANGNPKNILVPYEFLTNTYKVGRFIMKFIDLGYQVYFKPRSDEELANQLEAYCLSEEYRQRMKIVEQLDSALMQKIDIVAGTMTTLIYELLPYNKIVWVLDTEYRHLEDLVEGGYAHKVRYEDLGMLDNKYFTATEVDANYFFGSERLKETLLKHVLGNSSGS